MKKIAMIAVGALAMTTVSAWGAPNPPVEVKTRIIYGGIEVQWMKSPDDPHNVSGYEVVRGVFLSGPFQPICVTLKGAVSCTDRSAKPAQQYFYKVRSLGIGDTGSSTFTHEVMAQLPPPPQPAPER